MVLIVPSPQHDLLRFLVEGYHLELDLGVVYRL